MVAVTEPAAVGDSVSRGRSLTSGGRSVLSTWCNMNPRSDTSDTPAGVPASPAVFLGWWGGSGEVLTHTEGNPTVVIVSPTLSPVWTNSSCDGAFRLCKEPGLQINRSRWVPLPVDWQRRSTLVFYHHHSEMSCFFNAVFLRLHVSEMHHCCSLRWSTTCDCDRSHPECTAVPENGFDWAESTCWSMSAFCHHPFLGGKQRPPSVHLKWPRPAGCCVYTK